MLGGGNWREQNKILPGTYINFISVGRANVPVSERGTGALLLSLNWGAKITELDAENLTDVKKLLGYAYDSTELLDIREFFRHGTKLLVYRLNDGGVKASCIYGTAKYAGTRGNDLRITISANVEDNTKFDVITYLGETKVDKQTVATAQELVNNEYVDYITSATLEATAGVSFTGGTNSEVNGLSYSTAFDTLSAYAFNTIGIDTTTADILNVAVAWTERMRDTVGSKFQLVAKVTADYEGVISVDDENAVAWVCGAEAGCAVNKSCTNLTYDGEKDIKHDYTQTELEQAIKNGKLVFHKVGNDVNVLSDINSLKTFTSEKSQDFSNNQVIRVLDTVAISTSTIFEQTYLGKVQNDKNGRVSLKGMLVAMCDKLQNIGAIRDFGSDDIEILPGNLNKQVAVNMVIYPVVAMEQLYCSVVVG